MKIQKQDAYHGPVLMQIVEHPSFKALNLAAGGHGHYIVNNDVLLYVKYRSFRGPVWTFSITDNDVAVMKKDASKPRKSSFLILVCGRKTICALTSEEYKSLVDLKATNHQWIKVESKRGKQMTCSGSIGNLPHKIPHNRYPSIAFD